MSRVALFSMMFFVFAIATVISFEGEARTLTPLEQVNRCYAHLTGRPLSLKHPYRMQVTNGTKTAQQICEDLLDKGLLETSTGKVSASAGQEGLNVLRNFYDFHRTWFDSTTFQQMQGANPAHIDGTMNNFDSTESALLLTYVLFSPPGSSIPYSRIVRGANGVYAQREVDPVMNSSRKFPNLNLPSRSMLSFNESASISQIMVKVDGQTFRRSDATRTSFVLAPDHIQIGELVGIREDKRSLVIGNYNPYTRRHDLPFELTRLNGESAKSSPNMVSSIDIYKNQGGGILGLNSFIFTNWGLEPGVRQNGAEKMARTWTQSFVKSVMCRELPILRQADVTSYLASPDTPGVAPFRTSTTCVACHATMDQLAATGRNILISLSESDYASFSNPANKKRPYTTHVIGRYSTAANANYSWPAVADPEFHIKTPRGVLMYRSVNGNLVQQSVNSFDDIGLRLSVEPDIYQCAAKRYFEHFTGINVELYDPQDPANASKIASEDANVKVIRKYIEDLGAKLQSTQSVRAIVKDIMKSSYYSDDNYLQ